MRLSSLSENSDYDFPSSLKNQDPVLVSVLTARGGGLDFEDEEVDDVEEGAEAESTEASDEKSSEETNSDNSEENPNNLLDLCIIGLGNPGDKHSKTRHNAGYDYLEKLCNDLGVVLTPYKKLDGHYGETVINDLKIGFLKPKEYINNSGKSVLLVKKYHVKNLSDVLVIHDDMDLEPGEVKLKEGGGHGGTMDLKISLEELVKILFVKIWYRPPSYQKETNAWVIKKPNPQEKRFRRILCKSRLCQRFYS